MAAAACCSGTTPSCTRRSTGSATRRCARRSRATRAPHTSSASRSTVTSPDTSPSSPSSPARAATGGSRAKPGPPLNRYARSVRFRADRPLRLAPATVLDYRELARRRLPRQLFDYVDGGAYEESTLRSNVDDLERLLLRQVVMRDVSTRDQSVEVLGQQLPMPVVLAPVGLGGMLARRAEVQAARAAESAGVPFVESAVSNCSNEAVPDARSPAAFREWVDSQFDPSVTWDDIAWVREHWDGRLVVKGVLDPDDARRAVEVGVDGVVVSNHGGRQLDAVPSTARALPDIVDAVGGDVEVLVDGGVRTGLDVVKMVALGASAVLLGRAWAWAVAARGEAGVRHVLEVIKSDIDVALGLTGHTSIRDVDRSALYRADSRVSSQ